MLMVMLMNDADDDAPVVLMALWVRRVWKLSDREGRGASLILLNAYTIHCSVFQQEAVSIPHSKADGEDTTNGAA